MAGEIRDLQRWGVLEPPQDHDRSSDSESSEEDCGP